MLLQTQNPKNWIYKDLRQYKQMMLTIRPIERLCAKGHQARHHWCNNTTTFMQRVQTHEDLVKLVLRVLSHRNRYCLNCSTSAAYVPQASRTLAGSLINNELRRTFLRVTRSIPYCWKNCSK